MIATNPMRTVIRGNRAPWLLYLAMWALPLTGLGQASFDVGSVKRHTAQDRDFSAPTCTPGRFIAHALPVSELLTWAYDLRVDQFLALASSLPPWARLDAYDIEAKADKPAPEAQCKLMVQQLLGDRFRIKSHWKKLVGVPGYELRVAPKGHKLKPLTLADTGCGVHIFQQGQERPCDRYQWPLATKRGMTMKELAKELTLFTGRSPVFDKTGLDAEYKINLSFTTRSNDPQYPSLETAVKEQLGLELRRMTGDTEILVIDSISTPTAN